ncbi:MAG: protein kinase [Kouleothrix sp.]|nr:protein kinase [Kouleothrix sp.]
MNDLSQSYLGQYYLIEVIGRGSTSAVYKAFQSSLNRYVAVKVLASDIGPQFETRFQREAHAIAQLQHPNILPIFDYGQERGLHYLVMQYIESGATLDDQLAGRPIEPIAALRLILPLLSALKYAHGRGIVHRDIKPANIMLPQADWPLLADFGIAKLIDESQELTPPGQSVGTATYMAPERASSAVADVRTDLYSVGVVLYEMLTGQVPFTGASPVEVLRKHVHTPPPPPRSINPRLPAIVEPMLARALEKRPADRYQSAGEMAQDLERLIGQLERLHAQRQLQHLLQQPVGPPTTQSNNPYETRDLALGAGTSPRARRAPLQKLAWTYLGIIVAAAILAVGGIAMARSARGQSGAGAATTSQASPPPEATAPAVASASTSAPLAATVPAPQPDPTQPAEPTQPAPPPEATQAPSPRPAPAEPASTPQQSQQGSATRVRLEDTDWQGGYRRAGGRTYGGRTATWIYGTATEYSTMRASFEVAAQPAGSATLTVEGMDSEGPAKTPIRVQVNGVEIYSGPNPLPDDDHPLETGTWASYSWSFDAALLRPGRNEISVGNLAEGAFSLPPFFMLDYADLSYTTP